MGNLLRRVLAFVLGMVFTIAAAAGSMVGGAYWAYKNVKPVGIVSDDPAFGDLRDQSIEDLILLLNGALNDPDKYTLARLEAEYGLDLEAVLKKLGIENIDKTGSNWEALTAISLFSIKDGIPALLGEVKLRALYNFLPSLTGKRLKDILSPEAQEKLGDYTLMELFESDELTNETGLLKAIKNLRVGAVLPAYFDCEYDEETHTFNYVLSDSEEAQKLPVLKIVGNVSFGIINKIISGGDIMNELMEGSLSSVAEMPLEEILTAVASTISQDVGEKVSSYAKFLGGARLSDLFVKNADGGYEFYYAKVLGGVKLGYLFGLDDEDGDGVWTDKNGEPAKDMLQMLANLNVSSVFNDEGTFAMIRDLVGDLSVGMVLDMAGVKEGDIPLLDAISGLQVSELLKDQGKTFDANLFVKSLINNLASSLGDRTLGELIFAPGKEPTETNALIEALFDLKVSDFVKEDYTFESVLEAFRNALGNVSIGDIIGTEKNDDGTWKTDDKILALVLDFSFNNIFDVLSSDYSVKEIINSLLPETSVGEVFSAFMGFEYDDENGRYYKENNGEKKYLSVEISELFDCKLADVAGGLLDKNDPFDSYAVLEKVMLGDLADVIVTWLGENVEELSYIIDDEGNGRYVWEAQADGAVSDLLSTSLAGFVKDIYGGGNELLAKDVDDYVRIAGALTRFIAKKSGYKGDIGGITSAIEDIACDMLDGTLKDIKADPSAVQFESLVNAVGEVVGLIFPESETAVDKATVIVNDLFEGDVKGGVKVNETTEIKKLIGDSYSFVADFIPEGDFKRILGKTIEEYAALYGVRRIKEFKQATLDIDVREVVFAVRDIVLEIIPDDNAKVESVINAVAELAGDLISGKISDCGINQNVTIEKIVLDVKDIANVFIPEGKAKEISDAAFDGLAGLYGKEVLGNFGPASKDISLESITDYVTGVVRVAAPDSEAVVGKATVIVNDLFEGTLSGVKINETTEIKKLIEDVYSLACEFIPEGKIRNITDTAAGAISSLYGVRRIKEFKQATLDINVRDLIFAVNAIALEAIPESNEKVRSAVTATAELAGDLISGTIGNCGFNQNLPIGKLVGDVKSIADLFIPEGKAKNISDTAFDGIAGLYGSEVLGNFGPATKNIKTDELVTVVSDVIIAAAPESESKVESAAVVVNDLFSGTLGDFGFNQNTFVRTLAFDVYDLVAEFVKNEKARNILTAIICEGGNLYETAVLKEFVEKTKTIGIDDYIGYVANVAKSTEKVPDDTVNAISDLAQYVAKGNIKDGIKLDGDAEIAVIADLTQSAFLTFKIGGTAETIISAMLNAFAELYPDATIRTFVEKSKDIEITELVSELCEVGRSATDDAAAQEKVTHVEDLLCYVLDGKVTSIGANKGAYIVEACDLAYTVFTDYVKPETTVGQTFETIIEEMKKLYPMSTLGSIAEDSKALEVSAVIDSFEAIMAHITALKSVTDRIVALARGGLGGTIGSLEFDFEGLVKAATTVELIVGGSIVAVTGTLLYLFANDTLLTIIDKTIGKDRTIGKLLATAVGYTEEDGKYLFEGEENALANVLFGETVYAVATKGYDFKGTFYDYLLTDDIAMFAKAVVTKYAGDNKIGKAINAGLDGIADGYDGVHVSKIVDETGKIEIATVIETGTNVAAELTDGDVEKIVRASAVLAKDLFSGTISAFGVNQNTAIDCLVDDVKAIVDVKVAAEKTEEFFAALKDLYGSEKLANIGPATKSIEINKIVTVASSAVRTFVGDKKGLVSAIEKLVNDIFSGKVEAFGVNQNTAIDTLVADIKAIVNLYKDNEKIDDVFAALTDLYGSEKLANIGPATKAIEINKIVSLASATVRAFVGDKKGLVSAIEKLVNDVFSGKVEAFGVNQNTAIDTLVADIKAIVNLYKDNEKIDDVFAALTDLYGNEKLANVGPATKAIEINKIVSLASATVRAFVGDQKGLISAIEKLVNDIFSGEVASFGVNQNTAVAVVINDVKAIINLYKNNDTIDNVFAKLCALYGDEVLANFMSATKNIEVEKVVDLGVAIVKGFAGDKAIIDRAAALVNTLVCGKISYPLFNDEATVNEIADETNAIVDEIKFNEKAKGVVKEAISGLGELYNGITLNGFVAASKELTVAQVVDYVEKVALKAIGGKQKATDVVVAVCDLTNEVVSGTIAKANIDEAKTDKVVLSVKGVTDAFGWKYKVLDEAYAQLAGLYTDKNLKNFVNDTKDLDINVVIDAAAEVAAKAASKQANVIRKAADFANTLVCGKVSYPLFNDEATVNEIADETNAIVDEIKFNEKAKGVVKEAISGLGELYNGITLNGFVAASKELTVAQVVDYVEKVALKAIGGKQKATDVVVAVCDLTNEVVSGTIAKANIDEAKTDKVVLSVKGVTDAFNFKYKVLDEAYTQLAGLYTDKNLKNFVNDTKDLDINVVIDAAAEVAAKAASKQAEVIRKAADFANTLVCGKVSYPLFNDEATINEIADETNAIVDEIKFNEKAKGIVKVAVDGFGEMYGGITLNGFVNATKELTVKQVVDYGVKVSFKAVEGKAKATAIIDASASLVNAVVSGTIAKANIDEAKTDKVILAVKGVTDAFGWKYKVLDEAYTQLAGLYTDKNLKNFVNDTKDLDVNVVIDAAAEVAAKAASKQAEVIRKAADFANTLVCGKVSYPLFNDEATINEIADETNAIVDEIKFNEKAKGIVKVAVDGLGEMYSGITLNGFVSATKELTVKQVVDYGVKVSFKAVEGKAKATAIIDASASLVNAVVSGMITKANIDEAKTDKVILAVKGVTDAFNFKYKVLDEAYAQLAGLYTDKNLKNFVNDTKDLDVNVVIDAAAEVAAKAASKQAEVIRKAADFANTLVCGKVSYPLFNDEATVNEIADETNAIVDEIKFNEKAKGIVKVAVDGLGEMYGGITLNGFVSATKELSIDEIIAYAEKVALKAVENKEKPTNIVAKTSDLGQYIATGTLGGGIKFDGDAAINVIADKAKVIANAIGTGKAQPAVDSVFDAVGGVFNGIKLRNAKDEVKTLKIDKLIDAAGTIGIGTAKAFGKTYNAKITSLTELAKALVAGDVRKVGIEQNAVVSDVANKANNAYGQWLKGKSATLDGVVEELVAKVTELYPNKTNTFGSFVKDSKELEVTSVIDSASAVLGHIGATKKVTDRIAALANASLSGKLSAVKFDFDGLVKEAKWYELAIGGGVALGTGTIMYFVANDKLVALADKVAKDKTIGDFAAKAAGYTAVDGKYLYENEENELASTIFELKLHDVLTKGFDFKGTFKDKFVVDDIAMIAKAVSDKYASGKVETMLRTTFGEIAGLYPAVQVKDIVKATKELSMSGLFNSSAAIANAATDNKQKDRVDASAKLLDDMFYGTVSGFGFNPSTSISVLVSDAKAIVKGSDDVNAIFDKVGALYGDALLGKIVSASKNISISGLIDLGETIVDIATKKKYTERLDASAKLLDDMFYGTVSGFGFNPSTSISVLVSDAKAIVKGSDDVNAIFDKVGALYGDALLGKIVSASKNISISGLIDLGETIVDMATGKKYTEKLEAAAALLGETFYGTVSGFGFSRSANVSVMAAELNKIVGGMNVYVKASLGEIEKLTVNVYLGTIKADVKNIELTDVLASVKVVTGKANGLNAKLEKLYKYLELAVGGTIGNPSFNYSKAFDAMSKTEKLVVAGVAVGAGVVLYKINNALLVKIATKAFGKDSTWGEKFGKLAGYTLNGESGKYERSDGATNPMIDYLFKLNVVESLKTDFKLFDKAAEHVTLGNVLGFNTKTEGLIDKIFKGAELVLDDNDNWSIDRLALDHVENVLLNTNLKEVLDNKKDLKNYAFSKVDSFTLADLGFGSIVRKYGDGKKVKGFTATAEYDAETNLWTFDGRFEKLFDEVLNSTVGDIRNSKKDYGSFTKFVKAKFEKLSVGDVLCDFIGISMERKGSTDIETSMDEETGEWTVTGKYAAILDRLVNENLKTFIAKVSGKNAKAYLMSDRLLGGVRLGNLLDKGFNAYDETTDKWTNNEGEIEFANGFNGLLLKKVYNIKVSDVLGDGGFKVGQLTEGTYLAEVLGYVCGNTADGHKHDENCTWYKEADVIVETADGTTTEATKLLEADALYAKLCAITLDDLTGGADIFAKIKELSLGELMGYMKATEGEGEAQVTKYYNYRKSGDKFVVSVDPSGTYAVRRQGTEVGKLTATIAEVSVGSVMDGDGVNEMMNKIEALKIGDILRYTYKSYEDEDGNTVSGWFANEEATAPMGGMLAIFCDYTLGDVKSEDKLQEIVNKMTLRDVLGSSVDNNAIFKKLGDKKIGELTEAINDLYIGDILDYGKVENKTADGYRIYVDNDGNEYYNKSALAENGTFTGAWSSVDAADAATAAGIAFDSNVGRYKYADGKYLAESNTWNGKDGNAVTGVRSILANFKVGELDDPDFDARINSLVGTLVLSNVIEINTSSPKILQLLANSKLNELSEDINKLYIGEILDYSKITKTNADGYSIYADVDGNEYYRDNDGNWFKVDGTAASIALDDETGRYKDANGKFLAEVNTWYDKDNKEVTGVTAILADFRIGELDDSDFNARVTASVENRKLGELMTIDTNSARVLQSLKDVRLKDLSTEINAMTLDNFIAIDENSPRILYLVKDATLENLGATIDGLVLGDIMGYACGNKTEGHKHDKDCTWYTDDTLATPVEEIPAMIAKYTIKEVSDGNFASTLKGDINNLHISNFMAYDSCDIFKLFEEESTKDADGNIVEIGFNDLTIANMAESFNDRLNKPTLGDAVTLGVLDKSLFVDDAGQPTTVATRIKATYGEEWSEIDAKEFLTALIQAAFGTGA